MTQQLHPDPTIQRLLNLLDAAPDESTAREYRAELKKKKRRYAEEQANAIPGAMKIRKRETLALPPTVEGTSITLDRAYTWVACQPHIEVTRLIEDHSKTITRVSGLSSASDKMEQLKNQALALNRAIEREQVLYTLALMRGHSVAEWHLWNIEKLQTLRAELTDLYEAASLAWVDKLNQWATQSNMRRAAALKAAATRSAQAKAKQESALRALSV